MKTRLNFSAMATVVALLLLGFLPSKIFAAGGGTEWEIFNKKSAELYRAGQYERATLFARKALGAAEENAGADHPDVANSLNNLALLYANQGKYAEAEPLYKRSLRIKEKALGADYPDVATSLNNLAGLYRATGREAEAEMLEKQASRIEATRGG